MIHTFSMHGTRIALDVNSGAVHVVDDAVYDMLQDYGCKQDCDYKKDYDCKQNYDYKQDCDGWGIDFFYGRLLGKYSRTAIEEAYTEIKELVSKGQLFSADYDEELFDRKLQKPVVKALCLHISHDCNLRCRYCFAGTGSFGGERMHMSPEIGRKALDFLIKNSANRKHLEIDFFGGEPLLNFDTVKAVIEYGHSLETKYDKKFKFTLTTNAVLLNESIREYINENIQNIVLSIDGTRQTNDAMRTKVGGQGTYDEILPRIMGMAESRGQDNYYVRGTFTAKNLEFSKDVLHLAGLGFKQVSVEPVVAAKDTGLDIREEHISFLAEEYEKLALEYVKRKRAGKGFNFFHFIIDLDHGPCIIKRLSGCGAGHEYLAVTPEGDLYPCHQFVGLKQFKVGNVGADEINMDIQASFKESNIFTKGKCRSCWARFYCSGGCAANAYQFNNDIHLPYEIGCELEKKRVECALWIQAKLSEEE